jgi:hypothetical protein
MPGSGVVGLTALLNKFSEIKQQLSVQDIVHHSPINGHQYILVAPWQFAAFSGENTKHQLLLDGELAEVDGPKGRAV